MGEGCGWISDGVGEMAVCPGSQPPPHFTNLSTHLCGEPLEEMMYYSLNFQTLLTNDLQLTDGGSIH